jgi:hypothetical protein
MSDSRIDRTGDAQIWLVLLGIIVLFTAVILYARHVNLARHNAGNNVALIASYTNYAYGINLKFPPEWRVMGGYSYDRYEGEDGFFGISADGVGKTTIEELVKSETTHALRSYGSSPTVKTLTIDGQDARLILPSADQNPSMRGQAALIVRYPNPVNMGSATYNYFVFWADKNHIEDISKSITFIRSK